jgi:DNA-binding NarL/FixJ family response regulator
VQADGGETSGVVLIADDDEGFVACVQALLESAGYSTLSATTGEEALRIARQRQSRVILLDIQLPDRNGYEVCRALRDEFEQTVAIAFVSGHRTESMDISAGLLFGADDYIVKPFDTSELLARVDALMRRVTADRAAASNHDDLTVRELEILQMLASGSNQKEIAEGLSISPRTVGAHIEHILAKMGVHSRAQAVAAAYRRRVIHTSGSPRS